MLFEILQYLFVYCQATEKNLPNALETPSTHPPKMLDSDKNLKFAD